MEKETEIASALERIRAAENIFPRFGVTASDCDLSGFDESDEILGMVGIGVFEGFRINAFFSAREGVRAIVQNVLDVAGEIIKCVRNFFDFGKLGERFCGVGLHLVARAQGIDGKRFNRGFLISGVFFSSANDTLGRYECTVGINDVNDFKDI